MMHRFAAGFLSLLLAASGPASAQGPAVIDAMSNVIALSSQLPEKCLALDWKTPSDKTIARFNQEAEPALRTYLDLAKANADPLPAFKGPRAYYRWALDDVETRDIAAIRDPWAARVDRLELVDLTIALIDNYGRGVWRAYAADGTFLGTYDIRFARKTKGHGVNRLDLWSPGQGSRAKPLTPFCALPGDHEEWLEAKAEAERKKVERRAARASKAAE